LSLLHTACNEKTFVARRIARRMPAPEEPLDGAGRRKKSLAIFSHHV
jgi:hypothetical protein